MRRPTQLRRITALKRLKASTFEKSKACRTGSQTKEEWLASWEKDVAHLEEKVNGRKTS